MSYTIFDDGHISSPLGFRSTGVSAGLVEGSRARDLALVYSEVACTTGAMFTTSATKAAPIFFNHAILARNREGIRAVLINAGQANFGTGQPGLTDAVECAKLVADELEVPRDSVLLMSSGLKGVPLKMENMRSGIIRAVSELDSGGGRRAAIAIMTTDSRPKERVYRVHLRDGRNITLAGMAKGTRMIHPRLATLLCVITTDVAIDERLINRSLHQSVSRSFNRLAIDTDTSPNDSVILLSNGATEGSPITEASSWEYGAWQEALDALTADLANQVVRDAAGNGKIIQVIVRGASNEATARHIAKHVAGSHGVRRACKEGRPEWAEILAAVGATDAELRMDLLDLYVGDLLLMLEGMPVSFDRKTAIQLFSSPEIEFTIDLHLGPGSANVWTCIWPSEEL